MLKVHGKVSSVVDNKKVLEWTFKSPANEGIISIATMFIEAEYRKIDALLFYCWCYVRTQNFRNPCMKQWDYGNIGGNYATSRDGINAALNELDKYEDSSMMNEQDEVEKLYCEIFAFCQGVIYTPVPTPKPVPGKPNEPKPAPVPPKEPEPTIPPTGDSGSWLSKNWKILAGGLISILLGLCAVLPIPSFIATLLRLLLDAIKSALGL